MSKDLAKLHLAGGKDKDLFFLDKINETKQNIETVKVEVSSVKDEIKNSLIDIESGISTKLSELADEVKKKDIEFNEAEFKGEDGKDGDKGDKGDTGEPGKDGKDGLDGKDGEDGKDGSPDTPEEIKEKLDTLEAFDQKNIKDLDLKITKLATDIVLDNEDTPENVRDKLELLEGDERLDIKAVKGVESLITGGNTIINGSIANADNIGTGEGIFAQKNQNGVLEFKSLTAEGGIFVEDLGNELKLDQHPLTTSRLSGGVLSRSGTLIPDSRHVDITQVTFFIVDKSADPDNPTNTKVVAGPWNDVVMDNEGVFDDTYFAVDINGTLIQKSVPFTTEEHRDYCILGTAFHPVSLSNIVQYVSTYDNNSNSATIDNSSDIIRFIGSISNRLRTIKYQPKTQNPLGLQVDRTSGELLQLGINADGNNFNNIKLATAESGISIEYRWKNASQVPSVIGALGVLNPGIYDNGDGTTSTLPTGTVNNQQWTIQRIFYRHVLNPDTGLPLEQNFVHFGQNLYSTFVGAKDALDSGADSFEIDPELERTGATLRAFVIIRGGATDINDTNDVVFVEADIFNIGSIGATITSLQSLQSVYENSGEPEIVLDTVRNGINIRDGSTPITGAMMSFESNDGLTTYTSIDKDQIITNGLTVDTDTLVVDSTNNRVGIGTTSPNVKLDVNGGSIASQLHFTSNGTDGGGYLTSAGDSSFFFSGGAQYNGASWVARSTTASAIGGNFGRIDFYGNDGLISGNTFSFTRRASFYPSGGFSFGDTFDDTDPGQNNVIIEGLLGIGANSPNATLDVRGDAIFNEDGGDNDFRVEGLTDPNLLFVDASTNRVGIGTSSPDSKLEIAGSGTQDLHLNAGGNARLRFDRGSTGNVAILRYETAGVVEWGLGYGAGTNDFGIFEDSSIGNPRIFIKKGRGAGVADIYIDSSGNVGIGTNTPTNILDINGDSIRLRTAKTPASATATGTTGEIAWDSNYMYVCVATNTWKRTALSSW